MSHVAQIPPTPTPAQIIPDRLLLWHPRFVVCAVCTRPAAGFGFADPHTKIHPQPAASQRRRWLCSKHCQALFARHARKGLNMADLTAPQARALIEEAVEGFRDAMAATAQSSNSEVPF